jgi:hypothetical protein
MGHTSPFSAWPGKEGNAVHDSAAAGDEVSPSEQPAVSPVGKSTRKQGGAHTRCFSQRPPLFKRRTACAGHAQAYNHVEDG